MKDRVIILRTIKYSEADLIVHALNPQGGRLNFLARGALKSKKRFGGGVLEPTHYVSVSYRSSKSRSDEGTLHTLSEAELIKGFPGLRERYERLECALEMVAIVGRMAQPEVVDAPELFDLLGNGLFAAEASSRLEVLLLQFQIKLLYLQGVLHNSADMADFLRRPLKENELIQVPDSNLNRLKREVAHQLEHFLKGQTPFGVQGKELS